MPFHDHGAGRNFARKSIGNRRASFEAIYHNVRNRVHRVTECPITISKIVSSNLLALSKDFGPRSDSCTDRCTDWRVENKTKQNIEQNRTKRIGTDLHALFIEIT